ncbi:MULTISPECIES: hypothetical protein [unclassified Bradyrhizobium]|uniref:hypothetical protein n=1 Tax=unclassified Bradyrhizobium TaxID=2631580 RepID=UPI00339398A7
MSKRKVPEAIRPVIEAWEELRFEFVELQIAWSGPPTVSQAANAQIVQAMTECTRRLREISAEFYPVEDDDDDDEAD